MATRAIVDIVGSFGVFPKGAVIQDDVPGEIVSAWISAGAAESVEEAAPPPSAKPRRGTRAAPETAVETPPEEPAKPAPEDGSAAAPETA